MVVTKSVLLSQIEKKITIFFPFNKKWLFDPDNNQLNEIINRDIEL